jgi:excinuclease ABC subunit C
MPAFDSKTLLAGLPSEPGVYRMLDAAGGVLYVGKARDLRKRVASYFTKHDHDPRIQMMIERIADVAITVTRSEGEALILENNLIKSLAPRYNIVFRDDKSYPYLVVSGDPFPRLGFYRGTLDRENAYFGPYPSAGAVRESIHLLQKVFRLRTCENTVFEHRSRPCLLYQIKRCSGPCVGLVASEAYAEDVRNAKLFLDGQEDEVLALLGRRMEAAAERTDYEQAATYRDQIRALSRMQQRQYADTSKALDADAIAVVRRNGVTCVNLVMVRNGRYLGDKSFFPEHAEEHDTAEVGLAFVAQHYAEAPIPGIVILPEGVDTAEVGGFLNAQAGRAVLLVTRPQTERRVWLEMAEKNAELALAQRVRERGTQEGRLSALRAGLHLPDTVQRIECFDISHTQGEATVASCVVYDRLAMRPSEYRRYNIAGIEPGDDYAAMRQALQRRYEKISRGDGVVPDLLLIDGGKGQVGVAREVLVELGLADIALVGVAKGPERRPGLEELVIAAGNATLQLAPDDPGLHLIQQVRDEAHRFAITGHRARRAKARVTSTLEDIEGIGPKRRKQLLERFGGLRGVQAASIDDIAKIEGISRKLATAIYNRLH